MKATDKYPNITVFVKPFSIPITSVKCFIMRSSSTFFALIKSAFHGRTRFLCLAVYSCHTCLQTDFLSLLTCLSLEPSTSAAPTNDCLPQWLSASYQLIPSSKSVLGELRVVALVSDLGAHTAQSQGKAKFRYELFANLFFNHSTLLNRTTIKYHMCRTLLTFLSPSEK